MAELDSELKEELIGLGVTERLHNVESLFKLVQNSLGPSVENSTMIPRDLDSLACLVIYLIKKGRLKKPFPPDI